MQRDADRPPHAQGASRPVCPPPDPGQSGQPIVDEVDVAAEAIVLRATRALLRVDRRSQAARVLRTVVEDLGGEIVPAREAQASALPLDVSLGVGEPVAVAASGGAERATRRLARHLPVLVEDARAVADQCDRHQRQARRATVDSLTGVAGRGEIAPRLESAAIGDVVCLMDLDGFKQVNDTRGHAAGDSALRCFGRLLRSRVRDSDFVGRYGGDEFLVVFSAAPVPVVEQRLRDLAAAWIADVQHGTGISIGVAVVDDRGAIVASHAADRALYRAKRLGRDRVEVAEPDDFDDDVPES